MISPKMQGSMQGKTRAQQGLCKGCKGDSIPGQIRNRKVDFSESLEKVRIWVASLAFIASITVIRIELKGMEVDGGTIQKIIRRLDGAGYIPCECINALQISGRCNSRNEEIDDSVNAA